MRRTWHCLLALLIIACGTSAFAHESRPAYLEIKETIPGHYSVLWRTPVLSGQRLPVVLQLPPALVQQGEPVLQQLNDSLIERRVVVGNFDQLGDAPIEFIGLQGTITDVLVRTQRLDGSEQTVLVRPSSPRFVPSARLSGWEVAAAYLKLGIEHILSGFDHLLFVLALLMLCRTTLQLVKTITAFTVAHSVTLSLATLGIVHVPQRPVEAVIALSIVFVAHEVVQARRGDAGLAAKAPWIVAFVFGLLHGFGFAGALTEVGLPQGQIPMALLFFNLGVEVGQLLFVGIVLAVLALLRRARIDWPRQAAMAAPYAIGCLAMFWVFERMATF